MSDDDREPSSDPFGSPDSERGERGMTHFGATAWALLSTAGFILLGGTIVAIRRPAQVDLLTLVAAQAAVFLLILFLILRLYAPDISIRRFLGLRTTHPAFYPLAIMLGVIVHLPINALINIIEKRYPVDPRFEEHVLDELNAGTSQRIALGIAVVLIGPLVEEVFYRGALFRPMRKKNSEWSVILVTGVLFALAHDIWQQMVAILPIGIAMGMLRSSSGSLIPSILLHVTFNGVTFWAMLNRGSLAAETVEKSSMNVAIAGALFTFVLGGLVHLVGTRTDAAKDARFEDLT